MSELPGTLLVVDDDPLILQCMRLALPEPDYQVITAESAADGLAKFGQHQPDAVLLDIQLPDQSGLAALHELVAMGTLVVILPRRLQTLRSASRVVLLNGPRLAGEGNHAELLTDSDLYRHLNYLLFNPYRHRN